MADTIQRLEKRVEELLADFSALRAENVQLRRDRDSLAAERESMRIDLDRILARLEQMSPRQAP